MDYPAGTVAIFQTGSNFSSIAGTTLCLNGKELETMRIQEIKERIKNYLKTHPKIFLSEIANTLDVAPRLVGRALNELDAEGYIKEVP
ncbi:MAG: hypothetical protein V1735_04540 [Nanoarchaeota archaeon]